MVRGKDEEWKYKEFHRGAIVRVKLENFMSYDACEFYPGPRLNMVIGPNGSGKSTIVCALALGLGGNPKVMSRSETIDGYIKNGKDEARIEVELYEPDTENVIVVRRLRKAQSKKDKETTKLNNNFEVNGKNMGYITFKKYVKDEFLIQVDNLCQFLPQDKVNKFATLNERELLEETIRAGLGESHLEKQVKLLQMQKDLEEADTVAASQKKELQEKRQQMEELERQVSLLKEREKNEKKKKNLEDRIAYQKFAECRDRYKECKNSIKGLAEVSKQKQKELQAIRDQIEDHKEKLEKMKLKNGISTSSSSSSASDVKKIKAFMQKQKDLRLRLKNNTNAMETQVDGVREWKEEQVKLREAIQGAEHDYKVAQQALADFDAENENCEKLVQEKKNLGAQRRVIKEKELDVNQAIRQCTGKIKQLQQRIQTEERTLHQLGSQQKTKEEIFNRLPNRSKKNAVGQWKRLQALKNAGRFNKDVYLILLEVAADSDLKALYLERGCSNSHLLTFVTMDSHDRSVLMKEKGFSVIDIQSVKPRSKQISKQVLDDLSIDGYLDELIKGPEIVIQALRTLARIDTVVCGKKNGKTDEFFANCSEEFLKQNLAGYRVFSLENQYSIKTSRYSGRTTVSTETYSGQKLRPNIFSKDTSHEVKEAMANCEGEIESCRKELVPLEEELTGLEATRADLAEKKNQILQKSQLVTNQLKARKSLETECKKKKLALESYEQDRQRDQAKELLQHYSDFKARMASGIKSISSLISNAAETVESHGRRVLVEAKHVQQNAVLGALEMKESNAKQAAKTAKDAYAKAKGEHDTLKIKSKKLHKAFKEREPDMEAIADLDQNIDTLMAALALVKQQLSGGVKNYGAIEQYENLKSEIAQLEPKVANQSKLHETRLEEYEAEKQVWCDVTKDLVAKVNENFGASFEKVREEGYHCDGTVELLEYDNIAEYGIGINVKFRAEQPLQRLDQHTQSGGERSLTTFMYLLALNEVSKVPFRVVDEINQGMDAEKERISFYQLCASSCGEFEEIRAQYFLITPKLLQGLRYHPDITFHVIFNGPGALPQKKMYLKNILHHAREMGTNRKRILPSSSSSSPSKRSRS